MKSRIEQRYDALRAECANIKSLRKELKGLFKAREKVSMKSAQTIGEKERKRLKLLNISGHITMVNEKLKKAKIAYKNANREYQIEYRETYYSFNWLTSKKQ